MKKAEMIDCSPMLDALERVANDFAEKNGFECKVNNLYPFKIIDGNDNTLSIRFDFDLTSR